MKKRRGNGEGTVQKISAHNYKAIAVVGWKDDKHPIRRTKSGFRTAKEAREYISFLKNQMKINGDDVKVLQAPNSPPQNVVINIYQNEVKQKKHKNDKKDKNSNNIKDDIILNSNEISIDEINEYSGARFEKFCANILSKNGFSIDKMTGGAGDQGVDIIASKDDIKYAIQCKRYSNNLGNTPIQEVSAGKSFYNCHVGVVMTNSCFTKKAMALAKATGTLLWDRNKLVELINNISGIQ